MKVLFICGSLEPGHDGVGDYSRALAGQLIREGHICQIISLNDAHINNVLIEDQNDNEVAVPVLRLSSSLSWSERVKESKDFIETYNPDWISLQYVPYSFNNKGLPLKIAHYLSQLSGDTEKWHIMFHEIWVGISKTSSFKHKIIGFVQRLIAQSITKVLKPSAITTSDVLYQSLLSSANINAQIMPLFSNIPKTEINIDFRDYMLQLCNIKFANVNQYIFIGIFGTFYPKAKIDDVLNEIIHDPSYIGKKMIFFSFGRIGESGMQQLEKLKEVFADKIKFIVLGELSPQNVSTVLQVINIAISCTPVHHIGKSGVFSAMKLHGLKAFMSGEEIIPEFTNENFRYYEEFIKREDYKWGVKYIANKFISILSK